VSTNPLADAATVLATAVGEAEGARGAAAALACAGADADLATLFVDVGGRPPRPTLLASTAAHRLEERLVAHLPQVRVAARGQVCHLAAPADPDGLATAAAAVTVARGALAVLHVPPALLQPLLVEHLGPKPTGVLLRADVRVDRPLLALVVRELIGRDLAVAVLKQRLGWVAERRALFGSLGPGAAAGLPPRLLRQLALAEMGATLEPTRRPPNTGTELPAAAAVLAEERPSR
jgi:hypothetical protein